jgi:catechol 2,3-dioxygenase-like lactoylglutathione lyase family enzyme
LWLRKGDLQNMEQTDFRLEEVGVIMIGVSDLSRSLGFYCEKLGLNLQREFPGIAFLDGGRVALCLSEPAAKMRGRLPGSGEIGFSVKDVNAAYRGLEARGVTFTHGPRSLTPTHWIANFDDPDGNHLSISGPVASSPE